MKTNHLVYFLIFMVGVVLLAVMVIAAHSGLEKLSEIVLFMTCVVLVLALTISHIYLNHNQCLIGSSVGISVFPEHGNDAEILIKKADAAMYVVKHTGRNNFLIFQDNFLTTPDLQR